MSSETVILETCDGEATGRSIRISPENSIVYCDQDGGSAGSTARRLQKLLSDTFLPNGYPDSVRPEYLQYQAWDAVQGLSSYLRSVLTTRSVLAGIGVGSASATPLSAAMTWVLRDGCGMVGGLMIAYFCARSFETYTKEWRLFADFLNNFALTMDLLSSASHSRFYIPILLLSTLSKAGCGLIAGATKTRISAHFAVKGHLADVSAKESTQETAVALLGLILGAILAHGVADHVSLTWLAFVSLLLLHQYANYRLVKVLAFRTLNPQRAALLVESLREGEKDLRPEAIASRERLFAPLRLYWTSPRLGVSVSPARLAEDSATWWQGLAQQRRAISFDEGGRADICLTSLARDEDMLRAYLLALYLSGERARQRLAGGEGRSDEALCNEAETWWLAARPLLVESGWDLSDASALGADSIRYVVEARPPLDDARQKKVQ